MSPPESSARAVLDELLTRPELTDVCINGAREIYVDEGRGMRLWEPASGAGLREEELRSWLLDQFAGVGRTWDARHPFVDATLPSGHRLHVVFPPVAREGILVSLRRLPAFRTPGQDGSAEAEAAGRARWGSGPTGALFARLREAVVAGESVLISGATGSGKTTLANDLLASVPPQERIIALEDTPELSPAHPHFVSLVSRPSNADGFGEVTLRALLRQTLRMRPDRIILGECRGPEVLDLLQALNTGHQGAMATLHANSPREALRRVELLCLLAAGGALPLPALRELLASGIRWVAQVKRGPSGRAIAELWRIEGREGDTILMRPILDISASAG